MSTPAEKSSGALANWLIFLLILVIGYLFYKYGLQAAGPEPTQHHAVGATMSKFRVEPLLGDATALEREDLLGHVTLINFWGPWCGWCMIEMPHLDTIRQKYQDNDVFQLVAISYPVASTEDLRSESAAALARINVSLPVHVDPQGTTQNGFSQVSGWDGGLPAAVLVDRAGVIRGVWIGYGKNNAEQMQSVIEQVLAEG
jgi:thiol-disulfide isomerase/thioredoxin